jgi:hypothetical protein
VSAEQILCAGLLHLVKAAWRSFDADFGPFETEIRERNNEVKEEIRLASDKAADQERQLQSLERQAGRPFRQRAEKAMKEAREWRIQMDERKSSEYEYWHD